MKIGMLITDGGPHSAADWASVTASQLLAIAESADATLAKEARDFQRRITEILTPYHAAVQQAHRDALAGDSARIFAGPVDPSGHVELPFQAILAAAKGLSFEAHFGQAEVQDYIRRLLGDHFATVQHIERDWHAIRNPDDAAARAWRVAHHADA